MSLLFLFLVQACGVVLYEKQGNKKEKKLANSFVLLFLILKFVFYVNYSIDIIDI